MGTWSSNGNPIDGVVLYFHGRPTGDGIGFIDNQGSPSGWGKPLTDVTQLSRKSMDTLIVLSCHQAKGDSSFTYQMANRMTLNYAIASTGKSRTFNLFGVFNFWADDSWRVYQKHYPISDGDTMVRSSPQVTSRFINRNLYSGLNALFQAAGILKPIQPKGLEGTDKCPI